MKIVVKVKEKDSGVKKVKIVTEFIRLDGFLKLTGSVLSGGEAKAEIQSGKVTVDGEVCTMRGKKLRPGQKVSYNGRDYEVTD